jgi:hypothetical protein
MVQTSRQMSKVPDFGDPQIATHGCVGSAGLSPASFASIAKHV